MAGTELAKAYVQIIPSAQGISGKIQQAIDPEAEPAGASFGGKLVGKLKGIIATAAIGKALDQQSAREQILSKVLVELRHYSRIVLTRLRRMLRKPIGQPV